VQHRHQHKSHAGVHQTFKPQQIQQLTFSQYFTPEHALQKKIGTLRQAKPRRNGPPKRFVPEFAVCTNIQTFWHEQTGLMLFQTLATLGKREYEIVDVRSSSKANSLLSATT
jgi:hypothetical protein